MTAKPSGRTVRIEFITTGVQEYRQTIGVEYLPVRDAANWLELRGMRRPAPSGIDASSDLHVTPANVAVRNRHRRSPVDWARSREHAR